MHSPGPVEGPAITDVERTLMPLGLALVVVISLLLTILLGEPGVRGVPTGAT